MEPVQLGAVLAAVVLVASMLPIELGIAVALFELGLGVVIGNVLDLQSQEWLEFIAAFASIVLTFLAGLEVDPGYFRQRFAASVGIGLVSFVGPFVVGSLVAHLALDWTVKASLIGGTALSTTSLAVICAVLVEDGLTETELGKLLMSATFVTDLGTASASCSASAFSTSRCRRSSSSPTYGSPPSWPARWRSLSRCRGSHRGSFVATGTG